MTVKVVITNDEWAKSEAYSGGELAAVLVAASQSIYIGYFEGDYKESHWEVVDDDD